MKKELCTLVDDDLLFHLLETKYEFPKIKILCDDLNKIGEYIKKEYSAFETVKDAIKKELGLAKNHSKDNEVKNLDKQFILALHQLQKLTDKLDTETDLKNALLKKCKSSHDFQVKYAKRFKSFGINLN